jgi:hypothetical protein
MYYIADVLGRTVKHSPQCTVVDVLIEDYDLAVRIAHNLSILTGVQFLVYADMDKEYWDRRRALAIRLSNPANLSPET